jgi:CxxC motif-containing protein (DUF1111 family)
MNQTSLRMTVMTGAALLVPLSILFSGAQQGGSPPRQTTTVLGQALPGLSSDQVEAFKEGLRAFSTTETQADGLGPVFNGTSCVECHKAGAVGGAGVDVTTARVSRIGGIRNGKYSDLPELGGPVMQARSLREFDTSCPIPGETPPFQADFVSHRITTPLFGAGLIEAIPAATILARVGQPDPDGIHGVANIVRNPETGRDEVGRFGWKSQHSSLHQFAGDAYLNEMGVTSALFPTENLPQGKPIPKGWGPTASPEDTDGDAEAFTTFMRFLAPPNRRLPVTPLAQYGEQVFNGIRCGACHTPRMQTGPNAVAALSGQVVPLFSDLLLHQMGRFLADGIQQGQAKGDQFRTAPLWGLSRRQFFLHDGRALTIQDAIAAHDGEAANARNRFGRLQGQDRDALMAFLTSL